MESPSYRKLKKKFPNVKDGLARESNHLKSFIFSTDDRTINSLVLQTPEKMGLLLQAPTAVCKKKELSALAELVFRRLNKNKPVTIPEPRTEEPGARRVWMQDAATQE